MKNLKVYAIIAAVSLLVGRYVLQPAPKVVTKIVEKRVEVQKKETKKKVVSKKTKKPDGTVITDTTVTEDTSSKTETKTDKSTVAKSGKGVTLGLLAVKDLDALSQTHAEAAVIVPFFGNLSIAGSINTKKQVGVGLALEF